MNAGFTLIELLIVVVVLGILAAVVVFSLGNVTASAAVASCRSDVKTVQTAVQAYEVQNSGALPDAAALTSGGHSYLQSFPSSPYYTISLVNGEVMVAAPSTVTAVSGLNASSCSGAGTASSANTPTTPPSTVPVSNGVSVTPSTFDNLTHQNGQVLTYGGQEKLSFTNSAPITAMSVTISTLNDPGLTVSSQWNSFPGGLQTPTPSLSGGHIGTTWTGSGLTIPAHYVGGVVATGFSGTSTPHVTTGDTWSVTTTSGGTTSTVTGHL